MKSRYSASAPITDADSLLSPAIWPLLHALDVPRREAREDDHAHDTDDQVHHAVAREQEHLGKHDHEQADEAHEQDAAKAGQVALGDPTVDGGAGEDRGRTQERRHDARGAGGLSA